MSLEDLSDADYALWDRILDGRVPLDPRFIALLDIEILLENVQGVTHNWTLARMPDMNDNQKVYVVREGLQGPEVHSSLESFIENAYDIDPEEWLPERPRFHEEFWEYPSGLYHATPPENARSILKEGIQARSQTRGISNRGVGAAVFTVLEPTSLEGGSYGEVVFYISTAEMKKNGFTPEVSREPDVELHEQWSSLIHYLDVEEDYLDPPVEVEGGMYPDTVIVHDNIPPEYIEIRWGEDQVPEEDDEDEPEDSWW